MPKKTVLVPVNAPYGGSQGTTSVRRAAALAKGGQPSIAMDKAYSPNLRPASQPAPNTTGPAGPQPPPVPAPDVPVTRPKGPVPKPAPAKPAPSSPVSLSTPREARGASGRQGLIIGLGVGLILVNAVWGNNSGDLLAKVWQAPVDQKATAPTASIFPVIGEVIFLVILVMISRFGPEMESLVLTFEIGLWLLWAMFRLPAAYKAGIPGAFGQLFSGAPVTNQAGNTSMAVSTAPPALNPTPLGTKQVAGGSFVGTIPQHILG